eukprot:1563027-Lingulodinium_polyedra.AAC.1
MALIAGHAGEVMDATRMRYTHTCMGQLVGTTLPEQVDHAVLGVDAEAACGCALEPGGSALRRQA